MYTVQDQPPPPSEILLLPPLDGLYKVNVRNQEPPQPGILDQSRHRRNVHSHFLRENGNLGTQKFKSLTITG
jgi:hypothetical protein